MAEKAEGIAHFWSYAPDALMKQLGTSSAGLTSHEEKSRLKCYGHNQLRPRKERGDIELLLSQFKNPLILLLIAAATLSLFLGDAMDTYIIFAMILVSSLLGFWQERGARDAVEKLIAIVKVRATVLRDGEARRVPLEKIVPGDIVLLSAGDLVPADCLIVESKDLFVDEATLTGETYPAEKKAGALAAGTELQKRVNSLFMGTHVVSGTAKALVVCTGLSTEFGKVSERLEVKPPETEFEHGTRRFGYLLVQVTLLLVISIFAINVFFSRPVLESFLFALALAVGITPELLPTIISINLSQGAKQMAKQKVIVKRLASIENFGSMNVLCSDKTGTLTRGLVQVHSALDVAGKDSERVLLHAYLNAFYESGFTNPIDKAIRSHKKFDLAGYKKLNEIPYDFVRKRLSIAVAKGGERFLVTKGAMHNVLGVCSTAELPDGKRVKIHEVREQITKRFDELSESGYRVIGVAYKTLEPRASATRAGESEMTFLGFLTLFDPPKPGVQETLAQLELLGIRMKVITGDNRLIAAHVAKAVGLSAEPRIMTGPELSRTSDGALARLVNGVDIFAEVEPNQKERIILALKKAGNVVGYMGDGINDASALHAADVGISVDSAADVAKEAAEIVLLEKDLGVLVQGVRDGRTTFINTLKYVFITTSANFGNMTSMAVTSLFLPFLPLLPKQILLNNFMSDLPAMTVSTDRVDKELVDTPRRWDVKFIRNFMVVFGLVSSVFDFLTFGTLLFILHATPVQFRTGWFMESLATELAVMLIMRTKRPFFRSMPSIWLLLSSGAVFLAMLALPYLPINEALGFTPLPVEIVLILSLITALYCVATEIAKKEFYKRMKF